MPEGLGQLDLDVYSKWVLMDDSTMIINLKVHRSPYLAPGPLKGKDHPCSPDPFERNPLPRTTKTWTPASLSRLVGCSAGGRRDFSSSARQFSARPGPPNPWT
jgi:hypothetical protein